MKPCYRRLHISLDDVSHANLLPHLPKAVQFIAQALQGGGRVMVHCAAGISRSATVGCWAACCSWLHACQPQPTTAQRLHCAGGTTRSNIWLPCTWSLGRGLHHNSCPSHDKLDLSGPHALLKCFSPS